MIIIFTLEIYTAVENAKMWQTTKKIGNSIFSKEKEKKSFQNFFVFHLVYLFSKAKMIIIRTV